MVLSEIFLIKIKLKSGSKLPENCQNKVNMKNYTKTTRSCPRVPCKRVFTCKHCHKECVSEKLLEKHHLGCIRKIRDEHADDIDGLMIELAEYREEIAELKQERDQHDTETRMLFMRIRAAETANVMLLENIQEKHALEIASLHEYYRNRLGKYNRDIEYLKDEHSKNLASTNSQCSDKIRELNEQLFSCEKVISELADKNEVLTEQLNEAQNTLVATSDLGKVIQVTREFYSDMSPLSFDGKLVTNLLTKMTKSQAKESPEKMTRVIIRHLLRDSTGKLMYCCSDVTNGTFIYKDSLGVIKQDIDGQMLRKNLSEAVTRHFTEAYTREKKTAKKTGNWPEFYRLDDLKKNFSCEKIMDEIIECLAPHILETDAIKNELELVG